MAMCGLVSCEKEMMDYEGEASLYFDVRWYVSHINQKYWPHRDWSEATFGNMEQNDTTYNFKIAVTGYPADHDREFTVVATDTTNAVEGRDFTIENTKCVIKAGESYTYLKVTAHRSEQMLNDTLLLQLKIVPSDELTLMFTDFKDAPVIPSGYSTYNDNPFYFPGTDVKSVNHNAAFHSLWLYDVPIKPAGWYGTEIGGIFGKFTAKKWRLLMEITGTSIADFASQTTMPSARAQALGETFGKYLLDMAASEETCIVDEDGTMMWVNYIDTNGGTRKWSQTTTPYGYYNK